MNLRNRSWRCVLRLLKNTDKFDDSDYPENTPWLTRQKKRVDGEYKDEAAFILITELVSVRSNMYSPIKDGDKSGKTAKGIKKNVFKKNIKHEDYKDVLFNNKQMHQTMKSIRSNNHQL